MNLAGVGLPVEIEIYSDVVCPWCYIGKTRLDAALATYPREVTLRFRPFQLDPRTPHECRPLISWLGQRFGGEERARQMMARVSSVAAGDGLKLDFDRALIANSFDAHRLLWFADQPQAVFFGADADTQPRLAELLHRAHLTDGLNIASHDVLASLAEQVELDGSRVRRLLDSTEGTAEVRGQIAMAYDLGITAVPTFVFAGQFSISGAQEVETFRAVLVEVERRLASPTPTFIPSQRSAPAPDDDSRVA